MCLNVKKIHYFISLPEFFGNTENELGSMPGTAAPEGTARAQLIPNANVNANTSAIIDGQVQLVYSPPPQRPAASIWTAVPALKTVFELASQTKIIIVY